MLLVVAYDVANDRRRVRLHTLLLGYGDPVQESVFECELTPRQAAALKREVARRVRPGADRVRYYALCADCAEHIEDETGARRPPPPLLHIVSRRPVHAAPVGSTGLNRTPKRLQQHS
ncbi:MAG: CRISPR-associated endonuclease Cas2 [Chloroflexia bacterium]|nr:CRISPR-associated endonuclease Cas2 [Chloroflexia bacterium]